LEAQRVAADTYRWDRITYGAHDFKTLSSMKFNLLCMERSGMHNEAAEFRSEFENCVETWSQSCAEKAEGEYGA